MSVRARACHQSWRARHTRPCKTTCRLGRAAGASSLSLVLFLSHPPLALNTQAHINTSSHPLPSIHKLTSTPLPFPPALFSFCPRQDPNEVRERPARPAPATFSTPATAQARPLSVISTAYGRALAVGAGGDPHAEER